MSSLAYRQRHISECIRKYVPVAKSDGTHGVRDTDSGHVIASYPDAIQAQTQCRMLAAADIEAHYAELLLTVLGLLHGGKSDEATAMVAKFVQDSGRQA